MHNTEIRVFPEDITHANIDSRPMN